MKKIILDPISRYNKAFDLIRYINTMNRRFIYESFEVNQLWEYEAKNNDLFHIIKDWPKIIEENLKFLEQLRNEQK